MKDYFYTAACLLLFPTTLSAQETSYAQAKAIPLTLNQVWDRLQTHSTSIQIKTIQEKRSAQAIKEAVSERLPEIDAEGEYARVSNMPVYENGIFSTPTQFPVLHNYYKVDASAYLNLYNGNKTNLEISKRKIESKISEQQTLQAVSEVKLQATAIYLEMQRSLIFKNFLLKDIEAQQRQLAQIKIFQLNGTVLKSDVLRAELKLSRQKLALVRLENDLEIANQKLNTLIGLPDEQKITTAVSYDQDSIALKTYEEYLHFAQTGAYPIAIVTQEKELSALSLRQTQANISPKVGLFANYAYSYPQIFLYPYSANLYGFGMAGVKASFSISSLYRNTHKTKIAKLDYAEKTVAAKAANDELRDAVKEAYLRYKEALTRIEVTQINVQQARENQRIMSNTYFNHLSLITDLLDADAQLLQTHFDHEAAKIAARFQYYQLLNTIGKL